MIRSSFAKGVAAVAAGATALATVGVAGAQAQPYDTYGAAPPPPQSYADCKAQATSNGVVGALIGAGIGAVVGSHVAANHHRSDGGLVGAGVGGLAGAAVGSSSTHCGEAYAPPPPPPQAYAAPPPPPPAYEEGPPEVAYQEGPPPAYYAPPPSEVVVVYGYRGERYSVAHGIGPNGCGWAQAPVAGPYGVQPGWVRVCRGWHGRYHIVG